MSGGVYDGFQVERCRSEECQAPIIWVRMDGGRLMPVDAEPSDAGTVRVFRSQDVVWGRVVSEADAERARWDPDSVPLRTSHFATCSKAKDWRKPR